MFGFLQILVTIGVFPAVFRLDSAAVDMSKAALDFLPKIAWPLAIVFVVYLFSDEIRARIPDVTSAKFLGSQIDLERRKEETAAEAAEIQEEKEALEDRKKAILTEAVREITEPVGDEETYAQERIAAAGRELDEAAAELVKREAWVYGPIADALGDIHNAILLALQKSGLWIRIIKPGSNWVDYLHAYQTLHEKGLVEGEKGLVEGEKGQPTPLGHSYLDWLKEARPDVYARAASRYSAEE